MPKDKMIEYISDQLTVADEYILEQICEFLQEAEY